MSLPIDPLLPEISAELREAGKLVLAAPPGAGKTTRVPLELAGLLGREAATKGRVLVLEPRRVAARAAAARMAQTLGERVGETVGLSTRIDRRVSKATRVEVVTGGLFLRRLLSDPSLSGVGAVLFDEIHERHLGDDLALALLREAQEVFREDLLIGLMSATLDTARIADRFDGPVIEAEGRAYPVETRYIPRTADRLEEQTARAVRRALRETDGSVLAFLPGAADIRRTESALLEDGLPADVRVLPLFGALSPREQDEAVAPAPEGLRKVVLATDIAESSLTIDGVSTVVDCGLAKVPEYDAATGAQRLATRKISLASADQRRGRAGRTRPGTCYRLWAEAETRGLAAQAEPEILRADLGGLALSLAEWGTPAGELSWLDAPPAGRLAAAEALLEELGALDGAQLTARGKRMARLPLPPRLGALVAAAPAGAERALAAEIAAVAGERGLGGTSPDLETRIEGLRRGGGAREAAMRKQAARWGAECGSGRAKGGSRPLPASEAGRVLALGWPGRIAKRTAPEGEGKGSGGAAYALAGGGQVQLERGAALAKHPWLAVAELAGSSGGRSRITLAAPLSEADALAAWPPTEEERAEIDRASGRPRAERVKRLGAIELGRTPLSRPGGKAAAAAWLRAVEEDGLSVLGEDAEDAAAQFIARVRLLHGLMGEPWPDWPEAGPNPADWLEPVLGAAPPSAKQVADALKAALGWPLAADIDTAAPASVTAPSGERVPVRYGGPQGPAAEARVQSWFGASAHPAVAGGRAPLSVSLLSPARRAVAVTRDLPGFWDGGYADMAKDMRSQYPKHDWPEDPASARPHPGHTKARLKREGS